MLNELLSHLLGGNAVGQISQNLGTDEGTVQNAIGAALPLLIGAAAHQTSTPEGAENLAGELDQNHDGSILNNIGDVINNPQAGGGENILNMLFGGQRSTVESHLSQSTGLDLGQAGSLLMMLAPIVLGFLGKMKQENGLDASALAGLLGNQTQQMEQGGLPIMGILSGLLGGGGGQQQGGGANLGDILRVAGGLFGNRG